MRANLELKARCADLAAARERARAGRLKLRESSRSGAQLIPYSRADEPGAKRSDHQVIAVEDGGGLVRQLSVMLGVHRSVRKRREIALYENVRIHLDRVEGLGTFIELEAVWDGAESGLAEQQRKLAFLREALAVRESDLIAGSYETLLGASGS